MHNLISTGELSKEIGFGLSRDYLVSIGSPPFQITKTGNYWLVSEIKNIRLSIAKDLLNKI